MTLRQQIKNALYKCLGIIILFGGIYSFGLILFTVFSANAGTTSIGGISSIPTYGGSINYSPSYSGITLDAPDEKMCWVVQIPSSGVISKLEFRVGTVTKGTDLIIRAESVDTTNGYPTGNLFASNSSMTYTVLDTDDNVYFLDPQFLEAFSVNADTYVAIVITNPSGETAGNLSITASALTSYTVGSEFPFYASSNTTSGWASKTGGILDLVLRYQDDTPIKIPRTAPISATVGGGGAGFNATSNPDEIGLKYVFPRPVRACGAWLWGGLTTTGNIIIYDENDVIISTVTQTRAIGTNTLSSPRVYNLVPPVTLDANKTYRLIVRPNDTANCNYNYVETTNTAHMSLLEYGEIVSDTRRVNGGAWSSVVNRRPLMGLLIDQIDDGTGGTTGGGGRSGIGAGIGR